VREALIDIQFEPHLSLEDVDRYIASVSEWFGKKSDIWEALVTFGTNGADHGAKSTAIGRRVERIDGAPYVLQCRGSGFTLSRLSPYGQWADLRQEAVRLWELFSATVGAVRITRIAVRYVNEIKLALPIRDFSDFLTCPPRVPDELPQGISAFLSRIVVPDEAMNCVSVVTQAYEGPPAETPTGPTITVLLDIDVSRIVSLIAEDMREVWNGLDVLRDQKNKMFFGHLTETAVETYE